MRSILCSYVHLVFYNQLQHISMESVLTRLRGMFQNSYLNMTDLDRFVNAEKFCLETQNRKNSFGISN